MAIIKTGTIVSILVNRPTDPKNRGTPKNRAINNHRQIIGVKIRLIFLPHRFCLIMPIPAHKNNGKGIVRIVIGIVAMIDCSISPPFKMYPIERSKNTIKTNVPKHPAINSSQPRALIFPVDNHSLLFLIYGFKAWLAPLWRRDDPRNISSQFKQSRGVFAGILSYLFKTTASQIRYKLCQ